MDSIKNLRCKKRTRPTNKIYAEKKERPLIDLCKVGANYLFIWFMVQTGMNKNGVSTIYEYIHSLSLEKNPKNIFKRSSDVLNLLRMFW